MLKGKARVEISRNLRQLTDQKRPFSFASFYLGGLRSQWPHLEPPGSGPESADKPSSGFSAVAA
jgi:hypothetical protein